MHFKNDYKLSPTTSARIKCDQCCQPATTGQNNGGAPFWYHCDACAEVGRQTGHFYSEADSLQGCRESDRIAEGLDAMGNFAGIEALGAAIRQHRHTTQSTEVETIDLTPVGCQTPEGNQHVNRALEVIDRANCRVAQLATEMVETLARNEQYPSEKLDALKDAIQHRHRAYDSLYKAISGKG